MGIVIQPTLLNEKVYATFDGDERMKSLPGLCLKLLSEQKKSWPDLRKGCESLREFRERDVTCGGFSVRLQYNPGRIKSSLADVGEKKATERGCFLCLDHLPKGQKGLLYRGAYLILCNPMPIFSAHFTVSHVEHCRQAITEHVGTLFQLLAEFGSGWTVFYNGPKCGASAPDHLHFQAGPSGQMPVEKEIREEKRFTWMTQVDGVLLYRVRDLGREVVILEGDDPTAVGGAFKGFLNALKKVLRLDEEPMMNIAGFHQERKWRLVIFPRRKHRPDAFFREGEGRVVVSPGVIDMGGVLVTPVERDFERLDAAAVEAIYGEVSLEAETVEKAVDAMV
ncbi:MAG: DUF4922 domain-containing protein [bacterium]